MTRNTARYWLCWINSKAKVCAVGLWKRDWIRCNKRNNVADYKRYTCLQWEGISVQISVVKRSWFDGEVSYWSRYRSLNVLIVTCINHWNFVGIEWGNNEWTGRLLRSRISQTSNNNYHISISLILWDRFKLKLSFWSLVDARAPNTWLSWITTSTCNNCVRIDCNFNGNSDCIKSTGGHKALTRKCKLVGSLGCWVDWLPNHYHNTVSADSSWNCSKTSLVHSIIYLEMFLWGVLKVKGSNFNLPGILWRKLISDVADCHLKLVTWLSRSFAHHNLKNFNDVSC